MRPRLAPVFAVLLFNSACTPAFLNKYLPGRESSEIAPSTPGGTAARKPTPAAGAPATAAPAPRMNRPTIFAVDQGTFRIQLGFDRVWDATLDVLLRNYNLAIADKTNGLITTEWDSYYLDGKVHRNKVSLRLKRMAGNTVELTLFNNVEMLSKLPDGGITEIWLPTDKNKQEVGRLIQNMAMALGQPKPELPAEMMAGAAPAASTVDKGRF